jgi:hypothetical protein
MTAPPATITIRPAYGDDHEALQRLAALDSATGFPRAPLLIGEVDGDLWAALSLRDGAVIADPFHPTLALIALLRTHAAATERVEQGSRRRRRGRRYRLRYA